MLPTAIGALSASTRISYTVDGPSLNATNVTMETRDEIEFAPTFLATIPELNFRRYCVR